MKKLYIKYKNKIFNFYSKNKNTQKDKTLQCNLYEFIQETINNEILEDAKVNINGLKSQLKSFNKIKLLENPEKIIFLEGPWGIGKSYYVKNVLEEKIKLDADYTSIKISLFGLKSIDELKEKLVNKYIKIRQNKASKFLNSIWAFLFACLFVGVLWIGKFNETPLICDEFIFSFNSIFNSKCYVESNYFIITIVKFIHYIFEYVALIYLLFYISYFLYNIYIKIKGMKSTFIPFISIFDNKYLGSGVALKQLEINELFSSDKYIFIFDDIERISKKLNIEELFGFLNDLRENKGFNLIIIGNENELKLNKYYIKSKEKLEFQRIQFEYTKKRYENIKNYCLKLYNINNFNNLSKKIDQYLYKYIPHLHITINVETKYNTVKFTTDEIYNLRTIKKLIETYINIEERLKNIIVINNNDIDKLSLCKNNIIFTESKIEDFVNKLFDAIVKDEKDTDFDDIIKTLPVVKSNVIESLGITKLRALLNIAINDKNKEYKTKYINMLNQEKENINNCYLNDFYEKLSFLLVNIEENTDDEINIKKIMNYLINKQFTDITFKFLRVIQDKEILSSTNCSFDEIPNKIFSCKFIRLLKECYDKELITGKHYREIESFISRKHDIYINLKKYIESIKP